VVTVETLIERFRLFPLGLALLPAEVVPLHIFEERYKTMIDECLDQEEPFGIVWMAAGGLKDVGCAASVTQLLERTEDGRMNILVQGTHAFRLVRRIDDLAYPAGDIEYLDDDPEESGEGPGTRARYADLVERVTDSRPSEADLAELDAYGMAATLDFEMESKQELLELRSEADRLIRLRALFDKALKRIDHAETAAEQARSNGKVKL
jgi:Lon protease-like protein